MTTNIHVTHTGVTIEPMWNYIPADAVSPNSVPTYNRKGVVICACNHNFTPSLFRRTPVDGYVFSVKAV